MILLNFSDSSVKSGSFLTGIIKKNIFTKYSIVVPTNHCIHSILNESDPLPKPFWNWCFPYHKRGGGIMILECLSDKVAQHRIRAFSSLESISCDNPSMNLKLLDALIPCWATFRKAVHLWKFCICWDFEGKKISRHEFK